MKSASQLKQNSYLTARVLHVYPATLSLMSSFYGFQSNFSNYTFPFLFTKVLRRTMLKLFSKLENF